MNKDRAEQLEEIAAESEYVVDVEKFKDIKHNWVKRGIVISCENAGHPNHRHFLVAESRDTRGVSV